MDNWNDMESDFKDNTFNNPDGDSSGGVLLRQDCLYAQRIPDVVNDKGLERAFAKFGTVITCYVSQDPARRHALVTFQTHEEANRALVGLNNTAPLYLSVKFAIDNRQHKGNRESRPMWKRQVAGNGYATPEQRLRPPSRDNVSSSSSGRQRNASELYEDELQLAEDDGLLGLEDELEGLEDELVGVDTDLELKMKELKLIKAVRELRRAKIIAQMRAEYSTDRYMTADHKIIVKNSIALSSDKDESVVGERRGARPPVRAAASRSGDVMERSIDAELDGLSDYSLPALSQRVCVVCNAAGARFVCTRCDVTPYCSEQCQRADFRRHRAICHNLVPARGLVSAVAPNRPQERPSPLDVLTTNDREDVLAQKQGAQNNRPPSSGYGKRPEYNQQGSGRGRAGGYQRSDRPQRPQEQRSWEGNASARSRDGDSFGGRTNGRAPGRRPPLRHEIETGGEFGGGDAPAAAQTFPRSAPPKTPVKYQTPAAVRDQTPAVVRDQTPAAVRDETLSTVKTVAKIEPPVIKNTQTAKELPEHYMPELVETGTVMSLEVIALEGRDAHLCVALASAYAEQYQALCEELGDACDADTCDITAVGGEVVCVRDPADGFWYRARCLGGPDGGSAALLDAARSLPLRGVSCRKMPQQYRDMPEFSCVLQTKVDVKIGEHYDCTVKSKTSDAVTMSIKTQAGLELGDARVARWRPPVDKPQPSVAKPETTGANTLPRSTPQKTSVEDQILPTAVKIESPVIKKTPKLKEVPEHYMPELVEIGTVMSLEVIALEGRDAHLCVALASAYADQYGALCEELGDACDADTCDITAVGGEVVCVRDPSDGFWYRARCLGGPDGGSAVLLDAAKLLPLRGVSCRKMPQQFKDIPEFSCVLKTKADLKIGEQYDCTVKSKTSNAVTMSIKTTAGLELGDARVARWRPPVDKPQPIVKKPETTISPSTSLPTAPLPNRYRRLLKKPQEGEAPTKNESPSVVKVLPEKYALDTVSPGDHVSIALVPSGKGVLLEKSQSLWLCVTVALGGQYERLVDELATVCNADTVEVTPAPGEVVCVRDPSDGFWYRARCLGGPDGGGTAALIDAQRVMELRGVPCRRLPDSFADVPEFSCVMECDGEPETGESYICKVQSVCGGVVTMSLGEGDAAKVGRFTRWTPPVRGGAAAEAAAPTAGGGPAQSTDVAATVMEEYARPDLRSGAEVVLVGAAGAERVCVCPTERDTARAYDAVLTDVAVYGQTARELTVPPCVGALVVAQRACGNYYRAAVLKKKESQNKYLLEFLELGVEEKSSLERMRACPAELAPSARPVLTSLLRLRDVTALSEDALAYLEALMESATPLVVGLPSGAASGRSGSAATLVNARTKQSVNARVEIISKPSWKKMEEDGQSVLELVPLTLEEVEYVQLPEGSAAETELRVLDTGMLAEGLVTGCRADEPVLPYVVDVLPRELEAYCDSAVGREPYLPRPNELCIAKFPGREVWCRALAADQPGGPGEPFMQLVSLDHAHVAVVSVQCIRKMLPQFVRKPAVGLLLSIADFPVSPSAEVVERARQFLAGGALRVRACRLTEVGEYAVKAPALIAALSDVD